MKAIASIYFLVTLAGFAGETCVTYTYQVLSGLGDGGARVEKVYCADHYALSGEPTAFQLIAAPNYPPTNSPTPISDVNLASAAGIKVEISSNKTPLEVTINATKIALPKRFDMDSKELLRAVLESVRRTAVLLEIKDYHINLKSSADLEEQGAKLLKSFRKHPKSKPYWVPEN